MIIFTDGKNLNIPLEKRVEECIKKYSPKAIFLREKHLSEAEYLVQAKKIKAVCDKLNTPMFVCHHFEVAQKLAIKNLHLSFKKLQEISNTPDFRRVLMLKHLLTEEKTTAIKGGVNTKHQVLFSEFNLSVAVHNVDEAKQAQALGATLLVFGHIFETDCKKGLTPRGLEQLKEIAKGVNIPVVAIGGINSKNCQSVLEAGASDFAIMSSAMTLRF